MCGRGPRAARRTAVSRRERWRRTNSSHGRATGRYSGAGRSATSAHTAFSTEGGMDGAGSEPNHTRLVGPPTNRSKMTGGKIRAPPTSAGLKIEWGSRGRGKKGDGVLPEKLG